MVKTGRAPGTFRLDLSHVGFLCAGGCRAIDEGTREFRARAGIVVLARPSAPVTEVLRLSA